MSLGSRALTQAGFFPGRDKGNNMGPAAKPESSAYTSSSSNWTLGIWPLFLRSHNKSESMRLRLHVNYRQFFQARRDGGREGGTRGEGRGSLSVYSTHMNGTNLAQKLYPNIFLLSPWETGEETWSRVTGTSQNKKNPLLPLCELGPRESGFNYTPNNVGGLFLCGHISAFLQRSEPSCPIIL